MLGHDAIGSARHCLAVFGRDRPDGLAASRRVLGCAIVRSGSALDPKTCDRARIARDPRFDGAFYTGVKTTRIYCRPTCPVKPAKSKNVVFFPTAAAAERAGFRPCLRCRPETAPGTPAWRGAAATVSRALRLIERGFLDGEARVEDLADALGMTARHLRRLFLRHAGAAPSAVATTRRVQRAKALVDDTAMSMATIAFAAGFASIRRFNAAFRAVYRRSPTAVRRARLRRSYVGVAEARAPWHSSGGRRRPWPRAR
jgi:AraC family transcriptional regulator of adaptative response / DNA-3-methyladenine glycosylase II